jgi:hypothetical protein
MLSAFCECGKHVLPLPRKQPLMAAVIKDAKRVKKYREQ